MVRNIKYVQSFDHQVCPYLTTFSVATQDMDLQTHVAFILAAVTETILFSASILGFVEPFDLNQIIEWPFSRLVGALASKQSFTQIYAYTLYVHFILNVAVAAYLTYEVTRASNNLQTLACQTAIKDPGAQGQCTGLLNIARWVYLVVTATVLLVEMCKHPPKIYQYFITKFQQMGRSLPPATSVSYVVKKELHGLD